jgi:hypothetical protein
MSRRFQISLRAIFMLTMLVAVTTLPTVRLIETCRAWLFDKPALALPSPPISIEIVWPITTFESDGPPIVVPTPEDKKMPVIPFGRDPDEPIEL